MKLDLGKLNLALKVIEEEYKLSPSQLQILTQRLMSDDKEFEKMWSIFNKRFEKGTNNFKEVLYELIS